MNLPGLADHLRPLIAEHKLTAFIETGTGFGVSLDWAMDEGLKCWSCDVDQDQVEDARASHPTAHVHFSDSVSFLNEACSRVIVSALIWLDAHDPNKGENAPAWPIEDELAVIRDRRRGKDLILIDDMGDARAQPDRYAEMMEATHRSERWDNVLVLIPR